MSAWLLIAYLVPLAALVLSVRLTDTGVPQLADAVLTWVADVDLVPGVRLGHLEALANVVLFVPIGLLLTGLLGRRRSATRSKDRTHREGAPDWGVWLVATALSAGIEVTQMFLLTERSATVRDLVCNSAGALAGILIFRLSGALRRRIPGRDPA